MKRNIFILALCCLIIVFTGCAKSEPKQVARCVKCGNTATSTLMGPAEILRKNGISISQCDLVTGNVYSAPICDSCTGPVAELEPW